MAKSLVRRVIDETRRTLLVTTALIGLAGCKECDPFIPNLAPEFTSTPIDEVVRVVDELGISRKVAKLKPLMVVKG